MFRIWTPRTIWCCSDTCQTLKARIKTKQIHLHSCSHELAAATTAVTRLLEVGSGASPVLSASLTHCLQAALDRKPAADATE